MRAHSKKDRDNYSIYEILPSYVVLLASRCSQMFENYVYPENNEIKAELKASDWGRGLADPIF